MSSAADRDRSNPGDAEFDIDGFYQALDNDANETVSKLTHAQIKREKNDILQKLQIKGDALKIMHARLIGYRYIDFDGGDDVRVGEYVRWISLKRPEHLVLTNGAHVCGSIYKGENEYVRCKITRGNGGSRFFVLNIDETIIFQKLTYQEWIILDALDSLKE
jgi:hypothetical protein